MIIKAWFNSKRDYLEGLGLYLQYGTHQFLKKCFQTGPDVYNKQKLVEELKTLLESPTAGSKALCSAIPSIKNPEADHAQYLSLLKKRDEDGCNY